MPKWNLAQLLEKLWGRWNWTPPEWMRTLRARILASAFIITLTRGLKDLSARAKASSKQSRRLAGIGVLLLLGLVGSYFGYLYWKEGQPKPNYVTFKIKAPEPTNLETNIPDPLTIEFSQSVAPVDQLDKPIAQGIELKPEINGVWKWESDRRLQFTPGGKGSGDSDWRVGSKYYLRFAKNLFAEHILLEDYSTDFSTKGFALNIGSQEFYVDPRDPNIKKVVATVYSNYAIDTEQLKKKVSFSLRTEDSAALGNSGKSVPFSISFNKLKNEAYMSSDRLEIPKQDSVMDIAVDKGATAARGGDGTSDKIKSQVKVPGLFGKLKFESANFIYARNAKYEPEQALVLQTTSESKSEDVASHLTGWILPQNKPAEGTRKEIKNYQWSSESELTPEVLKESTPLKFELLPSAQENSLTHSFRLKVEPHHYIALKVSKGLKGYGGYELAKDWNPIVSVGDYPKELQIMSQGALLSLSGDKKLPMLARNIEDVHIQIARVIPDRVALLASMVMVRSSKFESPSFGSVDVEDLTENFDLTRKLHPSGPGSTEYFSVDLEPYLSKAGAKRGLFYLQAFEKKHRNSLDSRLILLTDLGLIVKQGVSGASDAFVQNLRTGQPVVGATVEVIGRNGISVLEQVTDSQGHAQFPSLTGFTKEKSPVAYFVRKDGDLAFLPYGMGSRQLEYSRFEVGGIYENSSADQLSSYVFSDRGIYRPGETAHFGLIVRSKNWAKQIKDAPLRWSVTDPRGNEVLVEKFAANSSDLRSLEFSTKDTSPTGVYSVVIALIKKNGQLQEIGSTSIRVEEFLPDKLRITTSLAGERLEGWAQATDSMHASVSLRNLFGTPAENRIIRGQVTLTPSSPFFRSFKDYQFANLNSPKDRPLEEPLGDQRTAADGTAGFDIDLSRFSAKVFTLTFSAEGFDAEGGRGVRATSSTLVSTLPLMIGIKTDGNLQYISKASVRNIHLIAVNSQLKKVAAKGINVVLVEKRYVSSLTQQPDGTYKYQSLQKEIPGDAKTMEIPETGINYPLPTTNAGDFALSFRNKDALELARIDFSVAGAGNLDRSLERNAELQLVLNKKDFQPGEEIELQIKAPYTGAGLIAIERDQVYASKWFKSSTTSTIEHIRIPEGLEGNAYVNVSFLRAIDSKEIFMSPLSYAVQPFSVSLDARKAKLKLEAPDKIKPGQNLKINYSSDRNTDIILYGVDEGILQVAHYQQPDPLAFFFKRRALQVATFQLLDLLLPEFSVVQSLSAPGGDRDGAIGKNLNPFKRKAQKPVAFWSGVLKASSSIKSYIYPVPDWFNGSIKVMAIAANPSSVGNSVRPVLSRGDFVITPSTPEFAAPGDEFEVGIGVSNQAEGMTEKTPIAVKAVVGDGLEIVGPSEKSLQVDVGRESQSNFRLRAGKNLGSSKLEIQVSAPVSGGKKGAKVSAEISIRPAVTYQTTLVTGLTKNFPLDVKVPRNLLKEFRKQDFALSALPLATGHALVGYLDEYPYGCTEQLLSKAVPAVFLRNHPEFGIPAKQVAETFANAISVLRSRQTADGGFALFSQEGGVNVPVTLYAIHFLLDAQEKGFAVPDSVLEQAKEFIRTGGARRYENLNLARLFAYSLYLQARAGNVPSNDLAFLRKLVEKDFKGRWEKDETAAYMAATYKLLKQDDEALRLMKALKQGESAESDANSFFDSFERDANLVYLQAKHFPEMAKDVTQASTMERLIQPIGEGNFNSHSSARALMAFDAILKLSENLSVFDGVSATEIDAQKISHTLTLSKGALAKANLSGEAQIVHLQGPTPMRLFYALTQSGFDVLLPTAEDKKGLEIQRAYFDKSGKEVTSTKLGEELTCKLRVRSNGPEEQIANIVLVDLLPGGFEIVMEPKAANEGSSSSEMKTEGTDPERDTDPTPDTEEPEETGDGANLMHGLPWNWLKSFDLPKAFADSAKLASLLTNYVDYREDRVVIYGLATANIAEFTYRIKAVSSGSFIVPPTYGEAMYNRGVHYRGLPGKITVEP